MATTGTRLSREQRRQQLLEIGLEMVTARSFDELSLDDVAEQAGISRSLLFHYFPTKHDYLVALAEEGSRELLDLTAPDPSLDPLAQLTTGLDRYVTYLTDRQDAYLSIVRGAWGGGDDLRTVIEHARDVVTNRIVAGVGLDPTDVDPRVWIAVHGWTGFVEEATYAWLDRRDHVTRDEHIDLLMHCLALVLYQVADPTTSELVTSALAPTT